MTLAERLQQIKAKIHAAVLMEHEYEIANEQALALLRVIEKLIEQRNQHLSADDDWNWSKAMYEDDAEILAILNPPATG